MDNGNHPINQNIQENQTPQTVIASQPEVVPQNVQQSAPPAPQQEQPPQDPQTGYETLEEQYRKAIDLRLLHYPHRVISKKLIVAGFKATESTVQTWFAKGGACHDVYEEMVKIRRAELDEQIKNQKDLIEQGTANALIIINKVLNKAVENEDITEQDAIAARDMLDRGGVPKLSKVDNNNKIDAEGVMAMANVIKGILEPGKKEEQQQQQQ